MQVGFRHRNQRRQQKNRQGKANSFAFVSIALGLTKASFQSRKAPVHYSLLMKLIADCKASISFVINKIGRRRNVNRTSKLAPINFLNIKLNIFFMLYSSFKNMNIL
jgi:hypothetical protein